MHVFHGDISHLAHELRIGEARIRIPSCQSRSGVTHTLQFVKVEQLNVAGKDVLIEEVLTATIRTEVGRVAFGAEAVRARDCQSD